MIGIHIVATRLRHSAPGGAWGGLGKVVEAVYHRFPPDGASKSIGARQSLKCGAPEE